MGWSCTMDASKTLDKLEEVCRIQTGRQNVFVYKDRRKYFFETNTRLEHRDGAVTGSIYAYSGDRAIKDSSFRIEPDGKISRGAKLNYLLKIWEEEQEKKKVKRSAPPKRKSTIPKWSPYYKK